MSSTLILILIVVGVILVIGLMNNSSKKPGEQRNLAGFEAIENVQMRSEQGAVIFNGLKTIYESGEDKAVMDYKDQVNSIDEPTDLDYIQALYTALLNRIVFVGGSKGLQLHPKEECLFSEINCAVYTIQKLNKQITYGGFRTNLNGYRAGTFSVNANDIEGFRIYLQGKVFVTNQRIVIIGSNKNKVIPLGKIISYAPYEKNGIIINVENGGSVLLDMLTNGTFEVLSTGERDFHDSKVGFLYALDNALNSK